MMHRSKRALEGAEPALRAGAAEIHGELLAGKRPLIQIAGPGPLTAGQNVLVAGAWPHRQIEHLFEQADIGGIDIDKTRLGIDQGHAFRPAFQQRACVKNCLRNQGICHDLPCRKSEGSGGTSPGTVKHNGQVFH